MKSEESFSQALKLVWFGGNNFKSLVSHSPTNQPSVRPSIRPSIAQSTCLSIFLYRLCEDSNLRLEFWNRPVFGV